MSFDFSGKIKAGLERGRKLFTHLENKADPGCAEGCKNYAKEDWCDTCVAYDVESKIKKNDTDKCAKCGWYSGYHDGTCPNKSSDKSKNVDMTKVSAREKREQKELFRKATGQNSKQDGEINAIKEIIKSVNRHAGSSYNTWELNPNDYAKVQSKLSKFKKLSIENYGNLVGIVYVTNSNENALTEDVLLKWIADESFLRQLTPQEFKRWEIDQQVVAQQHGLRWDKTAKRFRKNSGEYSIKELEVIAKKCRIEGLNLEDPAEVDFLLRSAKKMGHENSADGQCQYCGKNLYGFVCSDCARKGRDNASAALNSDRGATVRYCEKCLLALYDMQIVDHEIETGHVATPYPKLPLNKFKKLENSEHHKNCPAASSKNADECTCADRENADDLREQYGVRCYKGVHSTKMVEKFFKTDEARMKWVDENKEDISVIAWTEPEKHNSGDPEAGCHECHYSYEDGDQTKKCPECGSARSLDNSSPSLDSISKQAFGKKFDQLIDPKTKEWVQRQLEEGQIGLTNSEPDCVCGHSNQIHDAVDSGCNAAKCRCLEYRNDTGTKEPWMLKHHNKWDPATDLERRGWLEKAEVQGNISIMEVQKWIVLPAFARKKLFDAGLLHSKENTGDKKTRYEWYEEGMRRGMTDAAARKWANNIPKDQVQEVTVHDNASPHKFKKGDVVYMTKAKQDRSLWRGENVDFEVIDVYESDRNFDYQIQSREANRGFSEVKESEITNSTSVLHLVTGGSGEPYSNWCNGEDGPNTDDSCKVTCKDCVAGRDTRKNYTDHNAEYSRLREIAQQAENACRKLVWAKDFDAKSPEYQKLREVASKAFKESDAYYGRYLMKNSNGPSDDEVQKLAWSKFKQHWDGLSYAQQNEIYKELGFENTMCPKCGNDHSADSPCYEKDVLANAKLGLVKGSTKYGTLKNANEAAKWWDASDEGDRKLALARAGVPIRSSDVLTRTWAELIPAVRNLIEKAYNNENPA